MTHSGLLKNIEKGIADDVPDTLVWTPVLLSDSKGRYLKCATSGKSGLQAKIKWACKSGASTSDRFEWLSKNIDKLTTEYEKVSVYLWTGTCDLTFKTGKYVQLQKNNPVQSFQTACEKIVQLVEGKPNVKLTILHVPYYSIETWNKVKGHPDPSVFKDDDRQLTDYVDSLNVKITEWNRRLGSYAPKFQLDLVRRRGDRNHNKGRYSINFGLLLDGIHPSANLAKSWLTSLCRKISRDCTS